MSRKDRMAELDNAIGDLTATRAARPASPRSAIPIVNQIESVFQDSAKELETLRDSGRVLLELDPADIHSTQYQDRHVAAFADAAFATLVQDILRHGQLAPVLVRPAADGQGYELIAGHRRTAACRQLGRKVVARVMQADDRDLLIKMVQENEARADISAYERAVQLKTVLDTGLMSRAELMERLDFSKGHLSNLLKFAELPPTVVAALDDPRPLKISDGAKLARLMAESDEAATRVEQVAAELSGKGADDSLSFSARLRALMVAAHGEPTAEPEMAGERVIRSRTGQVLVRLSLHEGRPILRLAAGLPPQALDALFAQLPDALRRCGLDVPD
ncbi:ParB/RepB/Spo0J family partition protein [Nitrospirillum sp. BR 11828]|uniref:ParB/RepB/Spo0J family partition protein n=1 Tax=Nitrospirillum sp. BR 11828 TaxID=3104325 RepID=UPI002ACA2EED|nr:ParB/RepB/Spo0J family partition protein [Nitrospirillum sp. BR 11828]MDZ5649218.1 ParB/RepB/Spo0J family partition protein [Nitrospirillum sp. BR 11828]